MPITATEFGCVSDLVRQRSAIVLEPGKEYLVEARLMTLARMEGFLNLEALLSKLCHQPTPELQRKVVEAMTTNETSFFRDLHPFEALKRQLLPELIQKRESGRRLYIWSAACSSGQEPYSIAIIIRELFPVLLNWNLRLFATDLSSAMVARAREAVFSQIEINRGLPAPLLVKYFEKEGLLWRANLNLRKMTEFRELNLAEPWPALPEMDIIFLRNVLIYFDTATKKDILGRLRRVLRPDGYLFLGGAETTFNLDDGFERIQVGQASLYRLRQA